MGTKSIRFFVMGSILLTVAACGKDSVEKYSARSVDQLYNIAGDLSDKRRWKAAAVAYDEVERQHPYSVWARRAQLMSAYSHYMARNYDESVLAAERFLQLHPGNAGAPYAYYLIGLSHSNQIVDVGRDQEKTFEAQGALSEVFRRFPNSEYAKDAKLKFDLTRDHLAGKEMEVGRFYLMREEYLAALGRFQLVAIEYDSTSHLPEALYRLTETYLALGLVKDAERAAQVLGHNYPGNKWYVRSYAILSENRQD